MSTVADTRLFGLDVGALGLRLGRSLRALGDRIAQVVTPDLPVRLLTEGGGESFAVARGRRIIRLASPTPVSKHIPSFVAAELPPALYLTRELRLPPLTDEELHSALALEVNSSSPFTPDDLLWGYTSRSDNGATAVDVVIASRSAVATWLNENHGESTAEVWAIQGLGSPVVLPWGPEERRHQRARRISAERIALAAMALALLAAIVLTPVLQLRLKAISAGQAHQRLANDARPALDARAALMSELSLMGQVQQLGASQADPLKVLNVLSQFMPDNAWLQAIRIEGMTASLTGMATNATDLFQRLERTPGVLAVKPTSAVTRGQGGAQERFTVDIVLSPAAFGRLPPSERPA